MTTIKWKREVFPDSDTGRGAARCYHGAVAGESKTYPQGKTPPGSRFYIHYTPKSPTVWGKADPAEYAAIDKADGTRETFGKLTEAKRWCEQRATPYGKTFTLQHDVENVECWNWTTDERVTLPKGTMLRVEHVNDAEHTTCMAVDETGEAVELFPNGYRWIVNNVALAQATGANVPPRTGDLVGDIIAYEDGKATPKQTKRLFNELRKSGIGNRLQGHYSSRM